VTSQLRLRERLPDEILGGDMLRNLAKSVKVE
jgi:hypothetical protein